MSAPPTPILPSSRVGTPLHRLSSSTPVPPASSRNIYDRSLLRKRGEVSLSSFAYIFGEAISYAHKQAKGISDLENRLNKLGYHVGLRVAELIVIREGKNAKRETRLLDVLQFVHTTAWRTLFGKTADALEKSADNENEYMLIDSNPLVTEFVSIPRDMSSLNCAAFAAGIIEAILDSMAFTAEVSAHSVPTDTQPARTVYLVKLT